LDLVRSGADIKRLLISAEERGAIMARMSQHTFNGDVAFISVSRITAMIIEITRGARHQTTKNP